MFEQTFKNIDDILFKDAGCDSELDYAEQISWMLFLKYLDDLESSRSMEAELKGVDYNFILEEKFRWSTWAQPIKSDGKIDESSKLDGVDLIQFINKELWPYLRTFMDRDKKTIEYRIGEIFSELNNRIQSGYNLRECINLIGALKFQTSEEKHELSELYESRIKNMGNAGRNGGQYYTPRPLIRTMVELIDPKVGETVYDGACGSAGFLVEAFNYLTRDKKNISPSDFQKIQTKTLYGKEKSPLAYLLALMNLILHGVEVPNIIKTNTLSTNIQDISPSDRYDIVLANPPFGGKERDEFKQNFTIKSSETAYLFLQHFMKSLKPGGRCAIVIKNTFLSNTDNASISLRKELLESCDLHTILDLPAKTFLGAGVKTVVLFFEKGKKTNDIWYYQYVPNRSLGKTSPLNEKDLEDFRNLYPSKDKSENSWIVNIDSIDTKSYDLSVKNPNQKEEVALREPKAILEEMKALDAESQVILNSILNLL